MARAAVTLDDKYELQSGRIYLTGTQALVRLPIIQRQRDIAAGLKTAGFISGYRGSPLANYDQSLWRAKSFLNNYQIHFEPGTNEELAATAIWGSQQLTLFPGARYQGVFGLWYGKGPGVDRALDALRHANLAGTSAHGGVLALAGDDHAAVSSTTAHQSDFDFQSVGIPILYPATLREYLDFGLIGLAMSRFAGLWVALKCVTETTESSATIEVDSAAPGIITPSGVPLPPDGLHIRWPDGMLAQERRLFEFKLPAAAAFARANRLDREVIAAPARRLGIVSTGKSYLDVRQALNDLGITESLARDLGISLYKVGMIWPLEPEGLHTFAAGHEELLIVEEKRPLIEAQVRDLLYSLPDRLRPHVSGKRDPGGGPLLSSDGELRPDVIAQAIARRIESFHTTEHIRNSLDYLAAAGQRLGGISQVAERKPYFCSGCPHNTSTKVPAGSRALAGIGCHFLALSMNRATETFSQMGGEGVAWLGQAPFTTERHVFANIGDGTYFHSGVLAIRAAVAAKVNITYKLLYNDAVAMTGGQPVDGKLSVAALSLQLIGEGVAKIVVVSDDPSKYGRGDHRLPDNVGVRHRDDLDAVQTELRLIDGCTVIIYEQACAAEKRRRRNRGKLSTPEQRAFINPAVCEGCGDCSRASNCVSVEPLDTALGRKRMINQSSCNRDFTCLSGFCPSFVTVTNARIRRARTMPESAAREPDFGRLPPPSTASVAEPCDILITGIGGTGVITVGAVLAMAAHIDGLRVTVLDQTGLAQKNGAVMSHVRIGSAESALHAVRIGVGNADLVLACDMVTAASQSALATMRRGVTRAIVNSHFAPTGDFTLNPHLRQSADPIHAALRLTCGDELVEFFDATQLATSMMGDAISTNMFILGHACQRGLLPVSLEALQRAIEVNGTAVESNLRAFAWGRLHAHDPSAVLAGASEEIWHEVTPRFPETLEEIIAHRSAHLTQWQNEAWALQYRDLVARASVAESRRAGGKRGFATAVARNAAKLMSYKDEYEVARLYAEPEFRALVDTQFESGYRLSYHFAPPLIAPRNPHSGEPRKVTFGPWIFPLLKVLARLKFLRGTPLDLFGYSAERKMERQLIKEYISRIEELSSKLSPANHALAIQLASLPEEIRGYGHIKTRSLQSVRTKETTLLAAFRSAAERQSH